MTLVQKISELNLAARISRDTAAAALYQTLYGGVLIVGKNAGNRETTDTEAVAVVVKFVKGVTEMLSYPNSDERKEMLTRELELLEALLPEKLSKSRLQNMILGMSVTGMNKGQIMKHLKDHHSGQYDAKEAITLIAEALVK